MKMYVGMSSYGVFESVRIKKDGFKAHLSSKQEMLYLNSADHVFKNMAKLKSDPARQEALTDLFGLPLATGFAEMAKTRLTIKVCDDTPDNPTASAACGWDKDTQRREAVLSVGPNYLTHRSSEQMNTTIGHECGHISIDLANNKLFLDFVEATPVTDPQIVALPALTEFTGYDYESPDFAKKNKKTE